MTKLVWDQVGERRYEAGVSCGVLYLPDGTGVPWNGLTAVEEDFSDVTSEPLYYDGIKYLDTRYSGDFSATVKAFTYPEEFFEFEGLETVHNGMLMTSQPVQNRFGLSYRTGVGSDTDPSFGYKIHLLYNLTASPSSRSYASLAEQLNPQEFSWKLDGVPEVVPGFRPMVHVILDTTRLNKYLIADLEALLYGKDIFHSSEAENVLSGGQSDNGADASNVSGGTAALAGVDEIDGGSASFTGNAIALPPIADPNSPAARLPPLAELYEMVKNWTIMEILDNGDGTWTATVEEDFLTMLDPTTFELRGAAATYLDANTYEITTNHSF